MEEALGGGGWMEAMMWMNHTCGGGGQVFDDFRQRAYHELPPKLRSYKLGEHCRAVKPYVNGHK